MTFKLSGKTKRLFISFICAASVLAASAYTYAKIYIDITSPSVKKLPLAVYDFQGPGGKELADVVREDLSFTGLFSIVDKAAYIEQPSQPVNPQNWSPLGVEAVIKGTVTDDHGLTAGISLYDVSENREMMVKQYQGDSEQLRRLGHSISDDIYSAITGKPGVFKTKIAFVGEDDGEKGIYVMDWDGRRLRKLGLKGTLVLTPHWSVDGNRIIYSSERGRQWGIYLLDFLKMTEKKVFAAKGVNIAGDFFPDGVTFTFSSSMEGTSNIYVYSSDGGTKKITYGTDISVSPSISADGRQVAFVSDRGGSPQVYLMNPDGSEMRRLTFEGSYNTSPSWSPVGDRIVFSSRRSGKNQICTIKTDGTGLMQLTDSGNNEDPSFSPDGRFITFSSDRDGKKGVYIMRANGENQKKITPAGLKSYGPRWSPK